MGPSLSKPKIASERTASKRTALGQTASEQTGAAVRADAARVLHAVRADGRSLTDALAATTPPADARDRALLSELAFGAVRLLPRLEAITDQLLQRPLKPNDRILGSLLMIGLYQLIALRIPDHAAVSATVAATRLLERPRAVGLINASLRRFQRERAELLEQAERNESARWLMPTWLLRRLRAAWPEHWEALVAASNGRAPMFLRVNSQRIRTDDYAAQLAAAGIEAEPLPDQPQTLRLLQPVPADSLPGFGDGLVSVQDAGAQWAAPLLAPQPGERILDACAAPGGKTAHLIEQAQGQIALTAIDISDERMASVHVNLHRLGLQARMMVGDATQPAPAWADGPYQRILLDAPCSATGVMRRHPDIKRLRLDQDIAPLAQVQARMLEALWTLLAPGGRLLYLTCSLLPDENEAQIAAFLAQHNDASELPLPATLGIARTHGRQLLPSEAGPDGFYFALLLKR
ncbi:MAG: 16S rRNA (cytosine(967)-C(5))-methyltransferase RsmB [Chromatiaceae bacterium]|nr:16S rRNA (cytosine(967)-C(5))-methyltransferase RsmB [Chromatiaceae bacterium]MCF8016835.1 16S rRNA (cytosine(967)-C(5))-methyltransferase RsmB [Chromatiaceae bacterium]